MLKSILAALAIILATVFTGHHTTTVIRQPAAAVAAVSSIQTPTNTPSSPPVLPRPRLSLVTGASSKQSNRNYATANVGVVLGTSTQVSYVTQDELAAQIEQAAGFEIGGGVIWTTERSDFPCVVGRWNARGPRMLGASDG
jgi:hypothetical protein